MKLVCLLGLMAAFSSVICGQTATLRGQVTDESGAIVPGAKVTVQSTATNQTSTAEANELGFFAIRSQFFCTLGVSNTAAAFQNRRFKILNVQLGNKTSLVQLRQIARRIATRTMRFITNSERWLRSALTLIVRCLTSSSRVCAASACPAAPRS